MSQVKILVSSPFQVLCAWEFIGFLAVHEPATSYDPDIVLVNAGDAVNRRQMSDTAARLGLPVRIVGSSGQGFWQGRDVFRAVRSELESLGDSDLLVVGDPYYDPFADILSRSPTRHAWIIDDGVVNWRGLNAFVQGERLSALYGGSKGRRLMKAAAVGGVGRPSNERLRWFTIFGNVIDPHPSIYHNRLERSRVLHRQLPLSQEAVFLGSPLVTSGILSGEEYAAICLRALEMFHSRFPGSAPVYLRHRRESAGEDVGRLVFGAVRDSLGPAELRWSSRGVLPRAVAGVFSTALISLGELLPPSSSVVALWPERGFQFRQAGDQIMELKQLFRICEERGMLAIERVSR